MASSSDRRRRRRVAVHWPMHLFRQSGRPVESTTENLSSEGLYCITQEPFKQGERLQCMIVIPETVVGLESPILLECQVTIRRVENLRHGFGLRLPYWGLLAYHVATIHVSITSKTLLTPSATPSAFPSSPAHSASPNSEAKPSPTGPRVMWREFSRPLWTSSPVQVHCSWTRSAGIDWCLAVPPILYTALLLAHPPKAANQKCCQVLFG